MTSQQIKKMLLNYEMTEDLLWECIEINFKETIIGIFNALYVLSTNYCKNKELIENILLSLDLLAKKENNIENIKIFHSELKRINGNMHRNLKPEINYELKVLIKRLHQISRHLKDILIADESAQKIKIIETIINKNQNLKIISSLIRDNKDILKIKDAKNENILYKLLKRYSYLDEANEKEINYLYQVISLFINNDDINIDIIRNNNYYLSALKNKNLRHVWQLKREIELKNIPIKESQLGKRFNIYTKPASITDRERREMEIIQTGVIDFTDKMRITIDGEGTNCLDDALYWENNRDGSSFLYIDITSLSSILRYDSRIIQEALKREETIYLSDKAISLYPEYISNYLASLQPNQVRYTQTGIWRVEPDMTLVEDSFKLVKSTIKSQHKLIYDQADRIIANRTRDDLCQMLTQLGTFALRQRKLNNIKENYRQKENAYSTIPVHESKYVDTSVSANIVQECMLLFGRSKAQLARDKNIPYVFRACAEQKSMKLENSLLKNISIDDLEQLSNMIAYYTVFPERHCGLGYDVYSHSSSPARRASDTVNQFIDDALIFNPNPTNEEIYWWEEEVKRLTKHFNETKQGVDAFISQYNYLSKKKLIRKK